MATNRRTKPSLLLGLIGIVVLFLVGVVLWQSFGGEENTAVVPADTHEDQPGGTTSSADTIPDTPENSEVPAFTAGKEENEQAGTAPVSSTGSSPSTSATPAPVLAAAHVTMSYPVLLTGTQYYILWDTPSGYVATISLVEGTKERTTLPACTNMQVVAGKALMCTWTQPALPGFYGTEGYAFQLTVRDIAGKVIHTARSTTFSIGSPSALSLVPDKNTLYGFTVRYPENWLHTAVGNRSTYAQTTAGLVDPLATYEAFTIEYCAVARPDCLAKVDTFNAAAVVIDNVLAGLTSHARTYAEGSTFIRENLLERNGIAYFLSRRVLSLASDSLSPYTRASMATFGFIPSRVTAEQYALDEPVRTGTMDLELTDGAATYARLTSTDRDCAIELASNRFSVSTTQDFIFTSGTCRIKAHKTGLTTFEVTEDNCEYLRKNECLFQGTYERKP